MTQIQANMLLDSIEKVVGMANLSSRLLNLVVQESPLHGVGLDL